MDQRRFIDLKCMDYRVVTDYTNVSLENTNVKVYVRLRPPSDGTSTVDPNYIDCSKDQVRVTIKDPHPQRANGEHAFAFDKVFHVESNQDILFRTVSKPQVDHILNGYNSCCFAYGQTGSGKTYSMFGEEEKLEVGGNQDDVEVQERLHKNRGMIPRCIEYLVKCLKEKKATSQVPVMDFYDDSDNNNNSAAMMVSFLEIYCDQIRDLGKAYVQQQTHAAQEPHSPDQINPTQASSKTGGMADSLKRKTSELFARLQSAKQESFARIKSADSIHNQSDNHNTTNNNDMEFPHEVVRDTSAGPFMEQVYKDDYQAMSLHIREDPTGRVFVQDLACIPVSTVEEVMDVITLGLKLRATHETKMNQVSSRSHTVFTVTVMQKDASGESIGGTLHLVDLAGSERLKKSESQGIRLKEAVHINSSLTALGKVVMALDPTIESPHIPYRDCKLTRILQNSLGGNSYTAVIATMNPVNEYYEECLSSLQFANRCRRVSNQPRINYIGTTEADKDKRIKRLTEEVGMLTRRLKGAEMEIQQRILKILRDLGFNAGVGSDGLIDLGNGKKVGSGGVVDGQQGDKGGRAGRFNLGNDLENQRMIQMIDEFKEQIQDLTNKLNEKDSENGILKDEMEKLKYRSDNQNRELQLYKNKLQYETDKLKRLMRDHATLSKQEFEATLKRALANSTELLSKATEMVTNLPSAMRCSTEKILEGREAFNKGKEEEKEVSQKLLHATINNKDKERDLLKARYDAWLKKKDKKINFLLEEFSKYRLRKRNERDVCEKELLLLMAYSQSLSAILKAAETGKYPIKQTQKTVSLLIPKHHRPAIDIMKDSSSISYTKKLMKKKENKGVPFSKAVENSKLAKLQANASFAFESHYNEEEIPPLGGPIPETNEEDEEEVEKTEEIKNEKEFEEEIKNLQEEQQRQAEVELLGESLPLLDEQERREKEGGEEEEVAIPEEIKEYERDIMLYWRQRYKELRSSHDALLRVVAKLREKGVVLPRRGVPLPSLSEVRGPKRLNNQTPVTGTIRKFFN